MLKGGDCLAVRAAGLPDITGHFYTASHHTTPQPLTGGAFKNTLADEGISAAGSGQKPWLIDFSAALSNKIYGNSDTVQSPSLSSIAQLKF